MRDDCHVCGAKLARLAPSRHLRTVTCTSYPCAYIRVRYPIPLFIPQHHIPHPFHPVLAPVKRTPVNPVISRKLPPPSSLSLSLHSFPSPLPPFPFFYSCLLHATTRVHDRPTTTTTRTRTTMRIPRVCTRSYPDIWPSHFQVFPPWQEREVVPLILNCNVRFTSSGTVSFYNLNLFFFSKNREGARTKSWIRTPYPFLNRDPKCVCGGNCKIRRERDSRLPISKHACTCTCTPSMRRGGADLPRSKLEGSAA